jgi:hypothetical protein
MRYFDLYNVSRIDLPQSSLKSIFGETSEVTAIEIIVRSWAISWPYGNYANLWSICFNGKRYSLIIVGISKAISFF